MELLFASANKNKIKEIRAILPAGYNLLGLEDAGIFEEIPEPGATIKENSWLKARYVAEKLAAAGKSISVFADDSGLEVEALGNAPGVYSARYAGIPKSDAANNQKLLKELAPEANRNARFVTVITLITNTKVYYFEGEVRGTITEVPRGSNGFGYDPLFIPEGFTKTFAELGSDVKNTISHRANAVKQLIAFLSAHRQEQ